MKSDSAKAWIERAVWAVALAFVLWMGANTFGSARSEGPSEVEAKQHSSWILRFNGL